MKFQWLLAVLALTLAFGGWQVDAQAENLAQCVESYDPAVDYFPEKVEPRFAQGWRVEYFNHYKVVDVLTPFPGAEAEDAFRYVLVQCGTPVPDDVGDAAVISIPADDVIALSTTYIPHLAELGLLDQLIGMDSGLYVSNPDVVARFAAGELLEVGSGPSVNVELILDAEPSVVLAFGSGSPDYDTHPTLLAAGVPVVVASDYVERSPLGQAEWGKFIALFYNREAEANAVFAAKADEYARLASLTAGIAPDARPSVLWNSYLGFADAWFIPGSDSFVAQYVRDAGGVLVLGDAPETQNAAGGVPFSFEVVYEAGLDADLWMPGAFGVATLADFLAQDARYADFAAFANGAIYNYDARVNANGGNDYFERGVANPQEVLADLIALLHPELLPDHNLIYFRQLSDG
jgi:iron complex transport system substrate-binding protein